MSSDADMSYLPRLLDIRRDLSQKSCFLFGPRQTGKSSLIRQELKGCRIYNLLDSHTLLTLSQSPHRLSQEITSSGEIVVIDEIQKLPSLLDQVHLLIEERKVRFLLTGSSARKLRRGGVNLLGGRARSRHLYPFICRELGEKFELVKAINYGLLPSIYFSKNPDEDLKAYAGDYLQEEIAHEGLTRNIAAFSRFLEVAALCHGKLINFTEIANDAQVPRTTIHEYFQILKDTLIAFELPAWGKTIKRKPISTSKFYFFDTGVVRHLQHRSLIHPRSPEFGDAFEAFIGQELRAFVDYTHQEGLHYWRSTSGFEVDFILTDSVAIEVKGKSILRDDDLKGLKALKEEKKCKTHILVNLGEHPSTINGIQVLPWKIFLNQLWAGKFS
ncbi:MAG: ATP-binding protein [Deltaproteobacteria bacterium]|nr:ATP-binding protein [Deltaproteobacteria bacterium]